MEKQFFNYLGAIHIHTKLSDGTGDINSISKAAKKAGLRQTPSTPGKGSFFRRFCLF